MTKHPYMRVLVIIFLFLIALITTNYVVHAEAIGNPDKRYAAPGENFTISVDIENNDSTPLTNVVSETAFNSCASTQTMETQIVCKSVELGSCQGNTAVQNFGTLQPGEKKTAKLNLAFTNNAVPGKEAVACVWKINGTQNGAPKEILKPWNNVAIFVQVAQKTAPTATSIPTATINTTRTPQTPSPTTTAVVTTETVMPTTEDTTEPTISISTTTEPTVTPKYASINPQLVIGIIVCCIFIILLIAGAISGFVYWTRKQKKTEVVKAPQNEPVK